MKPPPVAAVLAGFAVGVGGLVYCRRYTPETGEVLAKTAGDLRNRLENRIRSSVKRRLLPFFERTPADLEGRWERVAADLFAAVPELEVLSLSAPSASLRADRKRGFFFHRRARPLSGLGVAAIESFWLLSMQRDGFRRGYLRYMRRILPKEDRFYLISARFRLSWLFSGLLADELDRGVRIRARVFAPRGDPLLLVFDSRPAGEEPPAHSPPLDLLVFGRPPVRRLDVRDVEGGDLELTLLDGGVGSTRRTLAYLSLLLALGGPLSWLACWAYVGLRRSRPIGPLGTAAVELDAGGVRPITPEARELLGLHRATAALKDPASIWPEAFGPGAPLADWRARLDAPGTIAPFDLEVHPPGRKDRILSVRGWGRSGARGPVLVLRLRDATELSQERRRKEALRALLERVGGVEAVFDAQGAVVAVGAGLAAAPDRIERLEEWRRYLNGSWDGSEGVFRDAFGRRQRILRLPDGFVAVRELDEDPGPNGGTVS